MHLSSDAKDLLYKCTILTAMMRRLTRVLFCHSFRKVTFHVNKINHKYVVKRGLYRFGWLFWVYRPFETVFQSISGRLPKRGRRRRERIDESKNTQTTPTRTYCKCSRPLPYCNPNCRTSRHWKFTQHHRTTRPPQRVVSNAQTGLSFRHSHVLHVHVQPTRSRPYVLCDQIHFVDSSQSKNVCVNGGDCPPIQRFSI